MRIRRRLPIGAEVLAGGGVHFRVFAPKRKRVELILEGGPAGKAVDLVPEAGGYFSGFSAEAQEGTLYRYRLDGRDGPFPDPASRFQPEGPHGSSQVIDPWRFQWSDGAWSGITIEGQVIYEMHIGTFTPEGTWEAAMRELPWLRDIGITVLEVMPIADFPGRFGWGYDGVNLFAPTRLYGQPDELRRFVDRAHALGLAVLLDVVYNHLGPDGNYLRQYADQYFTDRYENEWGEALNFDGQDASPVREYFIANAGYWIEEFHFDGLRLDATQAIHDAARHDDHVLLAITRRARTAGAGRSIIVIAENEPQHSKLVRPTELGGFGMDALWNDDFHHSAMAALTGRNEAYYTDYFGTPQEFLSAMKWGYLYQGQWYTWQKQGRGTPSLDIKPASFITFLQNHDQVANSAHGQRCHQLASPGIYRAMSALMLLGPGTPMLFMGQEFCASSPFLYFADHHPELGRLVREGRGKFLKQFPSLARPEIQSCLPDPCERATFERCKLDLAERERHVEAVALHKDLLQLRRTDPVFRTQRPRGLDGAVLGPAALLLRYFGERGDDRLLLVNLGLDLRLDPAPEPLLAPPLGARWKVRWSSESPRYGGCGGPELGQKGVWHLPGHAAIVLIPAAEKEDSP